MVCRSKRRAVFDGALSVKVSGDTGPNVGVMVSRGGELEINDNLTIKVSGKISKVGL